VESHPANGVVAHESRRHHQLREARGVHAVGGVALEVDPLAAEERDGIRRVGVTRHVEVVEIKLPDEAVLGVAGEVSGRVGECEADLDEVERVDVGLEEAVVVGRAARAVVVGLGGVHMWPENHPRKLSVHGDERVAIDEFADELELRFYIVSPYFTDHNWV